MDSLVSLVWTIAATVVAVPLIMTVLRPLVRTSSRARSATMRPHLAAVSDDLRPRPGAPPSFVEEAGIDTARAEASIEASALKRLLAQIDAHPDETRAVLRNWLHAA